MEELGNAREMARRSLLKRAGIVAGATVWATPTVQSIAGPAFASGSPAPCTTKVRFKYDISTACAGGTFDSGTPDPTNAAGMCLSQVDDYYGAIPVDATGCFGAYCVTVTLTCVGGEADKAIVAVSNGGTLLDVVAKAGGNPRTFECRDAQGNQDGTYTADLTRGISFVAGVFCVP